MNPPLDLLEGLNPAQRDAAQHTQGPAIIIAGAGSGKTRVLTHRLAYLIQQGLADPFELLALTFTNKAAREMRERIYKLIGTEARNIAMGTFHSLFSRILRIHAAKIGYTNAFTVYDDEDSRGLIKTILKEQRLDDKHYKPGALAGRMGSAKNYLVSPQQYLERFVTDDFSEITAKVYAIYQQRLFQGNAMDFDDLLFNMVVLFEKAPEVLYRYQHQYKYIMVDEYQDTNHAQYIIVKKLAAVHENLCVVGDDAQSIYSFRGANIENILNFEKDYPDHKLFKLEQNYRSTGIIVAAANEVIANNKQQIPKLVYTDNEQGELIRTLVGNSEQEEAQKVVDAIREQKMRLGYYNKDFALLYRTNAQSRALEDGLRRAGLVYRIFGGLSFYKRKEVKDVVAYLRLAVNPHDEEALKRIINYPARGIGDTTLERLLVAANDHHITLWQALEQAAGLGLQRAQHALEPFALLINSFIAVAGRETAFESVNHVAKHSGILKELHRDNTTEGLSRWENVQELVNAAREYTDNPAVEDKSLKGFLAEIALFTDADQKNTSDDYISLMTIHAAKGLEFNSVFVVGLEENLFPSLMAQQSRADLEEERRLFYVAVTRARKTLSFSYAKSRFKYGNLQFAEPSRFLDEVGAQYQHTRRVEATPQQRPAELPRGYDPSKAMAQSNNPNARWAALNALKQQKETAIAKPAAASSEFAGDDLSNLTEGQRVEHNKFGLGTVAKLEGAGAERRAHVHFDSKGDKTLILKYARLRLV